MHETLLSRVPHEQLPEGAAQAWEMLNELTSKPTFVEVFANAPELLDFVMRHFYMDIFFSGRVEEKYKQLARLRLSLLHGCRTCNLQNVIGMAESGYTQEQIRAMEQGEFDSFTEAEQAVIELADQIAMTNPDGELTPQLHQKLSRHFSTADICELGLVMGVISGLAKMAFSFNLVEKEGYCPFGTQ